MTLLIIGVLVMKNMGTDPSESMTPSQARQTIDRAQDAAEDAAEKMGLTQQQLADADAVGARQLVGPLEGGDRGAEPVGDLTQGVAAAHPVAEADLVRRAPALRMHLREPVAVQVEQVVVVAPPGPGLVVLAGGALNTAGFDETLGSLSLAANSTVDCW